MVDAMHAAGIEVWLDVVYNHTSEGDASGPTYNLRGIDNDSYYLVAEDGCVPQRLRMRQHHPGEPTSPCARSCCAACGTGPEHGRRRVPVRPGVHPGPRRRRRGRPERRSAPDQRDRGPGRPAGRQGGGRGLGHGRLPARAVLPRHHVAAVERPLPRRRTRLRQGRRRAGAGPDDPGVRQRRPVPRRSRRRLPALPERQLHHRPRRLLPLRPGRLQRAAQRGQRPRRHRRRERQPQLELRLGGRRTGSPTRSWRCACGR